MVADTAANYITEKPKGYPLGFFYVHYKKLEEMINQQAQYQHAIQFFSLSAIDQ
jgi:hypothetical protein